MTSEGVVVIQVTTKKGSDRGVKSAMKWDGQILKLIPEGWGKFVKQRKNMNFMGWSYSHTLDWHLSGSSLEGFVAIPVCGRVV